MFLFKNAKSIVKRIGMNMAVYGFAGASVLMILALFLPEIIANYIYVLLVVFSVTSIIGSISSIVCFFVELFIPAKSAISNNSPQTISNNVEYRGISLFHEGGQYQGTHIELQFKNNGEIAITDTGWWPAHRGASNGGQVTTKMDSDYFMTNSMDDFIVFLTKICKKDFSYLKNRQDIILLFKTPVFKFLTKEGQPHAFTYLGHRRYGGGYVSEDWYYLCKENDTYYLLIFTDNAEIGTGWKFTELFEGDYEKLVNENVCFWLEITLSKERKTNYDIRLTTIDGIQHLLPIKSSRCKFTDEDYLR